MSKRKKTKITITFDQHNLPHAKMKNISKEQILDASVFLNGVSREKRIRPTKVNGMSKFYRFILRLFGITKPVKSKMHNKIYVALPLIK